MTVRVDDYSTETGLRVRISCDTTGTAVQMPADEFHKFLMQCTTGVFDAVATKPHIPFVHWREGDPLPMPGGGQE